MADDNLYPRFALTAVQTALADTPATVIQGARQVGKSTLVRMLAPEQKLLLITLDDPRTLVQALDDPLTVVGQYPEGLLVIDEAQRAPGLILPIKASIDADRRPGKFLLTGSADLLQVKGVGDSLAGRAETVEIMPLSQGELARRNAPEDFATWILAGGEGKGFDRLDESVVIRGGFPSVSTRAEVRAQQWLRSYVKRLADHDARELRDGGYADQLESMLTYIASLGQTELVKASLARHLNVAESTVDAYWRLAKTMRLVQEIKAWNRTPHRRLVRRPKVCLLDAGLSSALMDFTSNDATVPGGREYYGSLVEQFVALELIKQQGWTRSPYTLYHFRDLDGLEVDLIMELHGGDLIIIEVKATQTPTQIHWKNLVAFRERFPDRNITGVLLHTGDFAATMWGWLHVLPITSLWQH